MQQIEFNGLQNRGPHALGSHHGYGATVFRMVIAAANKVVTAVAKFFQMIGRCYWDGVSWLEDRLIDYRRKTSFYRVLVFIPDSEREVVRAFALQLVQGVRLSSGAEILKAVINIPTHERNEVVTNVLLLIRPGMEEFPRIKLIEVVTLMPFNQRGEITTFALSVIAPDMDTHSMGMILKTVADLPTQERADVMYHARQVIDYRMRAYDRTRMIKNMARAPAHQRPNLAQKYGKGRHIFQGALVVAEQGIIPK